MEKEFIKSIVDDPRQSMTVPMICAAINDHFQHYVPKHRVYQFLTKELGYSYKRNGYSAPPAFEPIQLIIRYKICAFLIDSQLNNNLWIAIDESGCGLFLDGSRSWSKKGFKPYRMGLIRSQRLNMIMAITKNQIFAYQVFKGSCSEFQFADFIIKISKKLYEISPQNASSVLYYIDNHKIHTTSTIIKLLNILKIKTVFAPIYYCFLNPIEIYFSNFKRSLRKTPRQNL